MRANEFQCEVRGRTSLKPPTENHILPKPFRLEELEPLVALKGSRSNELRGAGTDLAPSLENATALGRTMVQEHS